MLRRIIAAVFVVLTLGASLAPAVTFAAGAAEAHGDCCCPDPALCPVVGGEHLCAWIKRGEPPPAEPAPVPAHGGPRIRSCSSAEMALELAGSLVWMPPARTALSTPAAERTHSVPAEAASRSRGADAPEPPPPRS